jgi:uncharacterized membrane protein (DUF106 family)
MELSQYLAGVFFAFSHYSQFHPYLYKNQIGDTTLKMVEYHIKRFDVRREELAKHRNSENYEQEQKKMALLMKKQNKLLWREG